MSRSKLSEGWKIVIGVLFAFIIGLGMSSKYEPSLTLIGALSAGTIAWLILQRF